MPIIVVDDGGGPPSPTPARLFAQCREALGMSREEMQDALCLMDVTTIEKIERGKVDVLGPSWVALGYLLNEKAMELELGSEACEKIYALLRHVDSFISAINAAAVRRRQEKELRRARRRLEQDGLESSPVDDMIEN